MIQTVSTYQQEPLRGSAEQAKWAKWLIAVFIFIACFADFIANEKPLLCNYQGKVSSPVLLSYMVNAGLKSWPKPLQQIDWRSAEYKWKVSAPIAFSPSTIDMVAGTYRAPFSQKGHYLGTDKLGRDVLAGLIHGARVSVLFAGIATLMLGLIGLLIGLLAGYYGDHIIRWSYLASLLTMLGFVFSIYFLVEVPFLIESMVLKLMIAIGLPVLFFYFGKWLHQMLQLSDRFEHFVPLDKIIMKAIEIFYAIPGLLLLIAILATIRKPGIYSLFIIITFLFWRVIALLARSESIKVRAQNFIRSAKLMGLSHYKIILRHMLPNIIRPVIVVLVFVMAEIVLFESSLSFLGLGLSPDVVTWGTLVSQARSYFSAWWLVVFPGICICAVIFALNRIALAYEEV